MALRVLGYTNVVEAKGTWPTNYIAKAQELELTKDVDFKSYNDGATRGNIAILIWNMLKTKMWEVTGESEGDGLAFEADRPMLEVKFKDYKLLEDVVVKDIEVESRKVTVALVDETSDAGAYYELAEGTDFLKLFGRTVTALYNKKDEVLVTITPSNEDKVVEGDEEDLEDYTLAPSGENMLLWGADLDNATFATAVIGSKRIADYTTYFDATDSSIVKEIEEDDGDLTIELEDRTIEIEEQDIEDILVLIDGEWAYVTDIEVEDVVTELVRGELYIVTRPALEGEFEGAKKVTSKDSVEVSVIVDGIGYDADNITYLYEYNEKGKVANKETIDNVVKMKNDDNKYIGQDVKLFLNFLGEVIQVRFDEVEDLPSSIGNFYVLTNKPAYWDASGREGDKKYARLDNEEEGNELLSTSGYELIDKEEDAGRVVFAKLDSKDRIKSIEVVSDSGEYGDYRSSRVTEEITDKGYLGAHKVKSSTVVVTIIEVKDDDDNVKGYEVETSTGSDALEGIDDALVIYETDDKYKNAKIVYVWEESKNTDKKVGIFKEFVEGNGKYAIIDDTTYELNDDSTNIDLDGGEIVVFTGDEEEGISIVFVYGPEEITSGDVVSDVEGRQFTLRGTVNVDLGALENNTKSDFGLVNDEPEDIEDYRFFNITVKKDNNEYTFSKVTEIDSFDDVEVDDGDYIAISEALEGVFIIRGVK